MIRIIFSVFIVLHGLVHLLYFGQSARYFELQPGMVWPDGSWALSRFVGDATTRNLASNLLILAAFSKSQSPDTTQDEPEVPGPATRTGQAALIEPLTARELEVLCLMAAGMKYKEIAARLFVSLNTVRYHVKAIYGKLNVNNRMQAIETARQLRIL